MIRVLSNRASMWVTTVILCLCGFDMVYADPLNDTLTVHCLVQSARLNFGRLNLQRPSPVAGEGEVVVACQNNSSEVRRVTLSVMFPSMGVQTALLQSGQGVLPVIFYRDPQFAVRWGNDLNGAGTMRVDMDFKAGEHSLLRLPVYALLHKPGNAAAGVYMSHVPVTLTTLPRSSNVMPAR